MRLHVAICDDENPEIEYLHMLLEEWAKKRNIAVKIQTFSSAEAFLFEYEANKSFDVLLLDIQMKEIDGIALAKTVRKNNDSVQIVFVTGFPDYIAEGYEVSALHYLMKPVSKEKLFEVLDRAKGMLEKPVRSVLVNTEGEMTLIPVSEIMCVEAQAHYVILTTPTTVYKTRMSISDMQTALGDGFFRCQRSFIVGLKYIRRIHKLSIVLEGGMEVPLSRELYNQANQAIIKYFP